MSNPFVFAVMEAFRGKLPKPESKTDKQEPSPEPDAEPKEEEPPQRQDER